MPKLTSYIEYLLMTRHYCHVPGHGAYMLVDQPASLDSIPGLGAGSQHVYRFQAPRRIVHFSTLHTHDDGILAALLMEAEGMTFDEANSFISRQAAQIPVDFADTALAHTDTDNLGFDTLSIQTWADIESRLKAEAEAETETQVNESVAHIQPADTVAIPRIWLHRAAAALIIAILFFSNFISLNQGQQQLASVIDTSKLHFAPTGLFLDTDDQNNEVEENASLSSDQKAAQVLADKAEASDVAKPIQPAFTGTTYYIIIASTYSADEAQSVCQRYHDNGFERMGVIVSPDGKLHRVFTDSFIDKQEAIRYLQDLRQQSQRLSKAWLLPMQADQSLSYIIKDLYNDNQLSMELSHPNQRTERDQG